MSNPIDYKLDVIYSDPKNPKMPAQFLKKQVPLLKLLDHMIVSQQRANERNINVLSDVVKNVDCPEFSGLCREQGQSLQPKTKADQQLYRVAVEVQ